MMHRVLCLALPALLFIAAVGRADQIDDFVNAEQKRQRIPGISIAVVKDGKIVKAEGYGLADVEHKIPAMPESVYKIGSISKQFLATGIMLLVNDGKLSLDDKISKHLEGTPESWQGITVRHLLTHTSGIVREAPGFNPFKLQDDQEVIKTAYTLPLRFTTGEKWEYCNVGYFALGEIIHRVSGKPWGDFLDERVFAPLGMADTCPTNAAEIIPNRADGYDIDRGKLQNADNWLAVRPSGAFLSTVLDLAKWEAALLTDKVLSSTIKSQMWTPVTLNDGSKYPYGLGWNLEDFRGVPTIQHGGSLAGFKAYYLRWPDYGLAVIVLANLDDANPETLATGIAVRQVPELNLTLLKPQAAPDPETDKLLRRLLMDYATGAKDLPQATAELQTALGSAPQSFRETLASRIKEDSALEFLGHKDLKRKGIVRRGEKIAGIWHYRVASGERAKYCSFYLTSGRRVAHLEFGDF